MSYKLAGKLSDRAEVQIRARVCKFLHRRVIFTRGGSFSMAQDIIGSNYNFSS